MCERLQRDQRAGAGRDANPLEGRRVETRFGGEFEHDVVLIDLREDGRHLALAERIVERVVDQLGRDPELAGALTVDDHRGARRGAFQVAGDVAQSRQLAQFAQDVRNRAGQLAEIGVLQGVLELRGAAAAADLQLLPRPQVEFDARNVRHSLL